jgi:hypothetical protein
LGLIIHQRSFEVLREKREPVVEYSLDREPWRAFRSSLAVEFTSRRLGGCSADQLSDQAKAEIISGLEARSAIISRYARIQSLLRDFVANAGFSTRVGAERGAYCAGRKEVLSYADAAEFIMHGFVEVREETTGAVCFRIRQWGRRQSFTSKDLNARAVALEHLAREAETALVLV